MKLTAIVLSTLMTGTLFAADPQTGVHPQPGARGSDSPQQKISSVLADLHDANHVEVMMGQLAKDKGQSPSVKSYGETLVKDHQDADNKVKALAGKKGVTLPAPGSANEEKQKEMAQHHDMMEKMQKLNGAEFDKEFARAMVDDHQKDIAKLKSVKQWLTDAETKRLVNELLPTLQKHQKTAEQILQQG